MILLQASHIQKHYDIHDVLLDAGLTIQTGERVALVGPNGAGKSTLLRILVGQEEPSAGDVSLGKDVSIGYVAQFVAAKPGATVFEYVAETFADVYDMERRLRAMEAQMANPQVFEDQRQFQVLSNAYDALRQQFEASDGYAVEARIRRVLDGLRFPPAMHGNKVDSLSGGQKTRLSLARLLAWQPDLLVLDEPTNYLDTDTITWLENYLQAYEGALLLVSHDRYFLDKVANVVYELEGGKTTRYVGNYSAYVEQKAAQVEAELRRYEAQQKEIARMETFIQKNIARATTTKRAQSRRKMLEKLERLERPNVNTPQMALRFACGEASGKDVLEVQNLVLGYPGRTLPGPLNLKITRGQRIAILGANGVGKSTFLKALVGRVTPLSGDVRWGTHVHIGYYDQEQADLHADKTVLEEIWDAYPQLDRTTVRTALGRFLFRGQDVDKPVAALSGGERSRLSLCKLMLQQANVLVLDEPTNHLDLVSKEVLEDALVDYEGTLLFVSHDRYFIDALATHVVTLDEHGFHLYIGNYSEYAAKVAEERKWSQSDMDHEAASPSHRPDAERTSPSKRVVRSADIRKLRDRVVRLEADIAAAEARQVAAAEELTAATIGQDTVRMAELQAELATLETNIAEWMQAWEDAAAKLEALESGQEDVT
ncbi:multidrug ABC transporter ATP-binding protein [Alicyclobacillus contaminans]|uniref:ABC-F family ATP-binding cassette domain-containing protein n=1 Tax=Alicyclobacillus contaminans TaxID=392016 RepID=UPI0004107CAB|nr:ABC-F family ATP-binding cassette domain-containing protein [Alicyclobacillus contaminans]GMA50364.1 multidrug ABC transporter ATP-binding protein [Alicyclobacillus contaminans]